MAHSILFKQCGSDHMTRGRSRLIDRIVVHYTSTLASARNNAIYFSRNERQGSSAHYFVDDISDEIYQSVEDADTAWHAGNWDMNCRSIGIEVVSAGEDYSEVEVSKLAWLVGELMRKYGIGASGVIRHYDVTGKICPAPYIEAGRWAALKARICGNGAALPAGDETAAAVPSGNVGELARRVIAGEFGNGEARRAALGSRYAEVQAEVNRLLGCGSSGSGGGARDGGSAGAVDVDGLARRVIAGEFGNGDERKRRLGADYAAVQARVNEMLGGGSPGGSGGADVDALARAVIRGDYGNGEERKRRLGASYAAVQRRVNEMLS